MIMLEVCKYQCWLNPASNDSWNICVFLWTEYRVIQVSSHRSLWGRIGGIIILAMVFQGLSSRDQVICSGNRFWLRFENVCIWKLGKVLKFLLEWLLSTLCSSSICTYTHTHAHIHVHTHNTTVLSLLAVIYLTSVVFETSPWLSMCQMPIA